MPPARPSTSAFAPILTMILGIALFSAMDAAIKSASLQIGVYSALLLRNAIGFVLVLPVWLTGSRLLPTRSVLRWHLARSGVNCAMALLFFIGLVRLPIAEGIALSFIAPLIALFLAALFLGETIRIQAIMAALLGIAGVIVIAAERVGTEGSSHNDEAIIGLIAILSSAVLYAVNLVLQRKLALMAGPVEVTLIQNFMIAALMAVAAPWLAVMPDLTTLGTITLGAVLATTALALFSWSYARAETQVLIPIEYTAFLWAALFGWLIFNEPVGPSTLLGTLLIVLGCWIGTMTRSKENPTGPTL